MKQRPMFITMLLSISLIVFSCKQEEKKPLEFHYYPDLNVYFDVAKKNYVFSLDGGNTWDTTKAGDQSDTTALGDKVVLQSASDSIWRYNSEHLQKYGGSIYTIVNDNDTATATEDDIITEKRVEKKPGMKAVVVEEEKPKKGLGKLLNKIFGKKKKKEDQK